jgi:hypothetical protein
LDVNTLLKEGESFDIPYKADPDDVDTVDIGESAHTFDLDTEGLYITGGSVDSGGYPASYTGDDIAEKLEGEMDIDGVNPFSRYTAARPEPILECCDRLLDLIGEEYRYKRTYLFHNLYPDQAGDTIK